MKHSLTMQRHERPDLRTALESAGFLVFDASDGGRERQRLREFWAALILLGLPMPRMGGLEVFRRLRATGGDPPEAIIVAHGRIPEAMAVLRLGAVDVLARPLTPEALRGAVEGIVRRAGGPRPDPAPPTILVAVDPLAFDLLRAKRALDRREFDEAQRLLRDVIELDPDSAVAHNLMGLLHERLGEHHASYQSFRAALRADRHYEPARENLRRYRERVGLDFQDGTFDSLDDRGDPPRHLGRSSA
jgi:DNA-binding response OmpR family regulator